MTPNDDPAVRLRRILDIYKDSPDDRVVLDASGDWADVGSLTLGDLRALARMVGA